MLYAALLSDTVAPEPLPWWLDLLQAAADWGKAPWEITGDDSTLMWFTRWQMWQQTLARARREKAKHGNR